MKRGVMVLMALMLLMAPLIGGANDQGWLPPEWNANPPARPSIDLAELVQMLMARGLISEEDYVQLTQPQSSASAQPLEAMGWRRNEGSRTPVQSSR